MVHGSDMVLHHTLMMGRAVVCHTMGAVVDSVASVGHHGAVVDSRYAVGRDGVDKGGDASFINRGLLEWGEG